MVENLYLDIPCIDVDSIGYHVISVILLSLRLFDRFSVAAETYLNLPSKL